MNRIHNLIGLMLILAPSALCGEADADRKALNGTWLPTAAELSGQAFPDDVRKAITLVIKGNEYTVTIGQVTDKGTVKIDATKKPRALDIVGGEGPNKGKTFLAIYELKGDTLRICYDLLGKKRPTEFATKKGAPLFLVTYRRAKS
ncbi:MAG: TIGR03067 domain-containing protein [Planctomycetes bacterium]|nr:TIGR03067 domain-containing protein [Planctomycetota bacterium]